MTPQERNALIEECARAAEAQDRTGYEWVRDSLWAKILQRAGANVRGLMTIEPTAKIDPELDHTLSVLSTALNDE
ncbi:hypothetical protein IVB40_07550 [Bradyrhizobium sp. 40]|uniref:hypothetical protein n=1 Tax=Bradyrhizobium sp. 40 TaxID=2782674 RepID=UPI001FFEC0B5|nr:hypothetical protein [Bradyrhizobium sp. 40]UPJ43915.1 hypothetical protein IVB40_07550 [Bradyrhizobium sp. 40]